MNHELTKEIDGVEYTARRFSPLTAISISSQLSDMLGDGVKGLNLGCVDKGA